MKPATLPIALALLATAACATPREPGLSAPDLHSRAPALELPTAGGGAFSLARAAGRGPVVVVFYRGLF